MLKKIKPKFDPKTVSSFAFKRYNYTKRSLLLSKKVENLKNSFENQMEKLLKRAENEPDNLILNLLIGKFGTKKLVDLSYEEKNSLEKNEKSEKTTSRNNIKHEISVQSLKKLGLEDIGVEIKSIPGEIQQENVKQNLKKIHNIENISNYRSVYLNKNFQNSKEFEQYSTANYFYKPYIDENSLKSTEKITEKSKTKRKIKKYLKNHLLRKENNKLRKGFNSKLRLKLDKMLNYAPVTRSYEHSLISNTLGEKGNFHSFEEKSLNKNLEEKENSFVIKSRCKPPTRSNIRRRRGLSSSKFTKKNFFETQKGRFSFENKEFKKQPTIVKLTN